MNRPSVVFACIFNKKETLSSTYVGPLRDNSPLKVFLSNSSIPNLSVLNFSSPLILSPPSFVVKLIIPDIFPPYSALNVPSVVDSSLTTLPELF